MEILSRRRCDLEAHGRKSSCDRAAVKSLFPKLTRHEILSSERVTVYSDVALRYRRLGHDRPFEKEMMIRHDLSERRSQINGLGSCFK